MCRPASVFFLCVFFFRPGLWDRAVACGGITCGITCGIAHGITTIWHNISKQFIFCVVTSVSNSINIPNKNVCDSMINQWLISGVLT